MKPLEMGIRPEMRKAQKPNTRGSASAGVPPRVGDLTRGQRGRAQHPSTRCFALLDLALDLERPECANGPNRPAAAPPARAPQLGCPRAAHGAAPPRPTRRTTSTRLRGRPRVSHSDIAMSRIRHAVLSVTTRYLQIRVQSSRHSVASCAIQYGHLWTYLPHLSP